MPRKKKTSLSTRMQHESKMAKLRTDRIKLKTLEYELKTAADKKRRIAEAKAHKQEMDTMEVVNKLMGDLVLSFQRDMFKARREAAKLRVENHKLRAAHREHT